MFWMGLIFNIVGIFFAIYGIVSSNRIKKLILNEKIMIRNKVLDIARTLRADIDVVLNDQRRFNDPTRDQVNIRIEYLQAEEGNLNRFAEELQKIG